MIVEKTFWNQDTLQVAKSLLGKILVRKTEDGLLKARIVETEAYHGMDDLASHASRGMTDRTKVMFGASGKIYVYMIYGMYYCLNIVTMENGFPAAVLIRSVTPIYGRKKMIENRKKDLRVSTNKKLLNTLANGPGKLCQAMMIDKRLNNEYVGKKSGLWIEEDDFLVQDHMILTSKRVGVEYAKHCKNWEWNFKIKI